MCNSQNFEYRARIYQSFFRTFFVLFSRLSLAQLSTTCTRGAFRVLMCPSSVVCRPSSVVRRASSTISLNIFSSQTAGPIWTKLGRNVPLKVFFKTCPQNWIPSKTLVAMATKLNFKQFLKNLLLRNHWSDFGIISQECSLGDPFQKLFAKF